MRKEIWFFYFFIFHLVILYTSTKRSSSYVWHFGHKTNMSLIHLLQFRCEKNSIHGLVS